MKNNLHYLFSFIVLLFISCSSENQDIIIEEELPDEPVVVEVDNPLSYRLENADNTIVSGTAYKNTGPNATLYLIASDGVEVECPGGLASSYDGDGEFFRFMFVVVEEDSIVIDANFGAEIDGERKTLFSTIPPACINEFVDVSFEEADGRVQGVFRGEFFYFSDVFVEPFENCENFISAGILEARFDLPLEICN